MALSSIEEALDDIRQGKFLIVVDDEKRENEGDLVMAAETVTPDAVNFMVTEARGLLCMPVLGERLDQLNMPLMVDGHNSARHGTAFTVSVDYNLGTTTGISASDRAQDHPGHDRPGRQARGLCPTGPHLPPPLPQWRGAGAPRPH